MPGQFRVLFTMAVVVVLGCGSLTAQESEGFPISIDVYGTAEWVSLGEGESYFEVGYTWGFSGSLALRSGSPFGGELFLAFTPSDESRDFPIPPMLLSGAWATLSLSKDPGLPPGN